MPLLSINTNQQIDKNGTHDFAAKASSLAADLLGKPERYVMVVLNTDLPMAFAGTTDACAYVEMKSLGLPEEQTTNLSKGLCNLISNELGIAPDRIYIEFSGPPRHMWGWNSATF